MMLLDKLTGKTAPKKTLGYHPMTDEWRISPWDCTDPLPLTVPEARTVLDEHANHVGQCVITRTALATMRRHRLAQIDAPTIAAHPFQP